MNHQSAPEHWQSLAGVAREASAAPAHDPSIGQPPPGFVTRVAALGMQARRDLIGRLWERWSLRTAMVSATAALVVGWVVVRQINQPCLEVPQLKLEIPLPGTP